MSLWAKLNHRAGLSQENHKKMKPESDDIMNPWIKPHLNATQSLGFSDAESNTFSLLFKPVWEEVFVCLQWKPSHKYRALPPLRQLGSLSLWGSALEKTKAY